MKKNIVGSLLMDYIMYARKVSRQVTGDDLFD